MPPGARNSTMTGLMYGNSWRVVGFYACHLSMSVIRRSNSIVGLTCSCHSRINHPRFFYRKMILGMRFPIYDTSVVKNMFISTMHEIWFASSRVPIYSIQVWLSSVSGHSFSTEDIWIGMCSSYMG